MTMAKRDLEKVIALYRLLNEIIALEQIIKDNPDSPENWKRNANLTALYGQMSDLIEEVKNA